MKDYNDFNMKFFNTNSMKLYNHNNGVIIFCLIFLFWAYSYGKDCPCSTNTTCIRIEFYGVQLNHFILFIILGLLFPSYFYTFQCLGILWEFAEHILDNNPNIVKKYIGGCLKYPPRAYDEKNNPHYNYTVYRGIKKPLNYIDKLFNVKNSTLHGWHGSIAELIPNFFGFLLGQIINKKIIQNKYEITNWLYRI